MCGKPKKGVPHHWNQVFSELTKVLKMGSAGRKELFDTLTRLSARDGTYMIFGESVLGKLAMTFLMAMVPVVELRGAIPLGGAAGALYFAAAAAGVRPDAEKRVAGAEGGSSGAAGAFEGAEGAEVPDAGAGAAGGHPPAGNRGVDRGAGGGRAGSSHAGRSAGHRRRGRHRRVHHHGGYLRRGGPDVRGGTKSKLSGLITIKNGS